MASRPAGSNSVDRKLDLLMKELKRYSVSVAGIQETKWFGNDVWTADGYTFLHPGRPLPEADEPAKRNEGVGIALDKAATEAWRESGEEWEAVSSRIITARLKLARKGQRRPGETRETSNTHISVLSVYAPTAKATPNIKQNFFSDLQDTLDRISPSDVLIMLGDFNARVGRLGNISANNDWAGTIGKHGLRERNEASEELLEVCATNQLTLMNTWFEKRDHHLGTWMHPATKKHHMIDYIIMRSNQRSFCTDVQVMRGANYWTDHRLVRAKVRVRLPPAPRSKREQNAPIADYQLYHTVNKEAYRETLDGQLLENPHNPNNTSQQNWDTLRLCIISAAEKTLGRSWRKQPDWFQENIDTLSPLITAKNKSYDKFLRPNTRGKCKDFRRHQRKVKRAVDAAKEEWICKTASEAEGAGKDGRTQGKA